MQVSLLSPGGKWYIVERNLIHGGDPMKKQFQLTSAALHLLAMALMLCDHLLGWIAEGKEMQPLL